MIQCNVKICYVKIYTNCCFHFWCPKYSVIFPTLNWILIFVRVCIKDGNSSQVSPVNVLIKTWLVSTRLCLKVRADSQKKVECVVRSQWIIESVCSWHGNMTAESRSEVSQQPTSRCLWWSLNVCVVHPEETWWCHQHLLLWHRHIWNIIHIFWISYRLILIKVFLFFLAYPPVISWGSYKVLFIVGYCDFSLAS